MRNGLNETGCAEPTNVELAFLNAYAASTASVPTRNPAVVEGVEGPLMHAIICGRCPTA
jgi:hypothetical protein